MGFALLACALTLAWPGTAAAPPARTKKLIEAGWDEPDPAFMRRHIAQMEATPFDGCVYRIAFPKAGGGEVNFTWECWGKRAFTAADLAPAITDLDSTEFRRFRHNFLRFNVTPGDVDWFDDFSAILNNARLAAEIARGAGSAGVWLDTEPYKTEIFDYRKQRDRATRSWDEYAAQARRRGREVMEAFQDGYPDLTLFLSFGYTMPWSESLHGIQPLGNGRYGLLVPFLDGMVEGARGKTRLVDGHEISYPDREPWRYSAAYKTMSKDVLRIVGDRKRYREVFSFSFGIWLDYYWKRYPWDHERPKKNYFPPRTFERVVRKALQTTDEYVWVYSETPRWWTAEGGAVKLPADYPKALRSARRGLTAEPESR